MCNASIECRSPFETTYTHEPHHHQIIDPDSVIYYGTQFTYD